jgi:hypothetical protein
MKTILIAMKHQIINRTEKAVQVDFLERKVWLPISQIEIKDDCIFTSYWTAKSKMLLPWNQNRNCFVG